MTTVTKWIGVAVALQSALGADKTITALTLANPGVATSTAHGLSNGTYVVFAVTNGMYQIDQKVVRIANVATNTFELEGVDTTSFTAWGAGTCAAITFGTSIVTALNMNAAGGDFDFIDTTTIHDYIRKQIPGLPNAISYTFDNIWDSADAGQIAMKAASESQGKRAVKMTFGTGGKILVYNGYVGFHGMPGGQAPGLVTTQATFTMFGTPTNYAS